MATPRKTSARTLVDRIKGNDFLNSIPAKWKTVLSTIVTKTPGVELDVEPDEPAGDLVQSQVTTDRTNEREKVNTEVDTSVLTGVILHGQDYDEETDVVIPKNQYLTADGAEVGQPRRRINPLNRKLSEVEQIDVTALEAYLEDFVMVYPGKINIDLPDKLLSITGVLEKVVGKGGVSEVAGTPAHTGDYSINLDLHATAQVSAIITPDAFPVVQQFWGNGIACTHYHFYLKSPVSKAQMLAKLEAVSELTITDWPKFAPKTITVKCVGGKLSAQLSATSKGSDSVRIGGTSTGTSSTTAGGTGYSEEVGLEMRIVRIPSTLHAAPTLDGVTSDSQALTAVATADATDLGIPSTINYPADTASSGIVNGAITVYGSATTPTGWPTSGNYLFNVQPTPFKIRFIQFHCVVVDATDFPT